MSRKVVIIEKCKRNDTAGVSVFISDDDLVMLAQENPEFPLIVKDKDAFIDEFVEQLEEGGDNDSQEQGITKLQAFIDENIQMVFESGSDSVEEKDINHFKPQHQ